MVGLLISFYEIARARIFKHLRNSGFNVVWRAGWNRYLDSLKGLQIRAQFLQFSIRTAKVNPIIRKLSRPFGNSLLISNNRKRFFRPLISGMETRNIITRIKAWPDHWNPFQPPLFHLAKPLWHRKCFNTFSIWCIKSTIFQFTFTERLWALFKWLKCDLNIIFYRKDDI